MMYRYAHRQFIVDGSAVIEKLQTANYKLLTRATGRSA